MDDSVDQPIIAASIETYNQAAAAYQVAEQAYNRVSSDATKYTADQVTAASNQLDSARTALGAASRNHSDLLAKLAIAHEAHQRAAKDPNQQRLWANEADRARTQSDLYGAEAEMYQAKTQAQIDTASTKATAALQRAQAVAGRMPSQNDQSESAAMLNAAKAAAVPALTQSTVALHTAQIQLAGQRGQLAIAQATKTQAQADFISGPQAETMFQRGELYAQQRDYIVQSGGAKIDDLVAKGVLDKARAEQIRVNMAKWQVLPSADKGLPTLTEFQPMTGQLAGVPNPSYVNPAAQPTQDLLAAIDKIQGQIASGQIQPAEGDQLIANLKSSLDATSRGFSPEQYQQRIQQQADFGKGIIGGVQSQGNTMADRLISASSRARTPVDMSPYESAIGMAGGTSVLQQALDLMGQVKPITDHASSLDAIMKYGAAKALLESQPKQADTPAAAQTSVPAASPGGGQPYQGTNPNIFGSGSGTVPPDFAAASVNDPARGNSASGAPDQQAQRLLQASMGGRNF